MSHEEPTRVDHPATEPPTEVIEPLKHGRHGATREVIIDMGARRPGDYSDVETSVLRAISTAEMYASLRVSGEEIDGAAAEKTIGQIQALRLALEGVGTVGQHFNAVGQPVGDQVALILTTHDVETLIMRLTGKPRFGTM